MLIPQINPDEFGPGYMIRLGLCNQRKSFKEVSEFIFSANENVIPENSPLAVQLATVLEMDVEQFCQNHTLLPIYRSITNSHSDLPHGSLDYEYGIRRYGHFAFTAHLKVCEGCIQEDLKYLGYSYYRRSHQLSGSNRCTKHRAQQVGNLKSVSKSLFLNPDMAHAHEFVDLPTYNHPVIDRFEAILHGVCDFVYPVHTTKLINDMQIRARSKNLYWGSIPLRQYFSDFIIENLPMDWLLQISPNFKNKKTGIRSTAIDGILSPAKNPSQSLLFVLALAVLYEDSDEVLSLIDRCRSSENLIVKSRERKPKVYWGSNAFKDIYINELGVAANISRKLNMSQSYFSQRLIQEGIPAVGKYSTRAKTGFLLFSKGASIQEAIDQSGCSSEQLEMMIRKGCAKFSELLEAVHIPHEPSSNFN